MIKKFLIFLILILLYIPTLTVLGSEQGNEVTYTYYSNGEVNTRKETTQYGLLVDYKVFDQEGNKLLDYSYQSDGTVYEKISYYTNGNYKTYMIKDHDLFVEYRMYYQNGKLSKDYDFCSNGEVKRVKSYDTEGQMTIEERSDCQAVEKLSVAQFNILKYDDETLGTWSQRKDKIIKSINSANTDIISLNEVYDEQQSKEIEEQTDYKIIQPTDGSEYGWTSAIGYDPRTIHLIDSGGYKFKNQEIYTSGSLAGKPASRTAVWGLFEKNGIKFILISGQTQNDWNTNVRFLQLYEMRNLAQQLSEKFNVSNVIVAGDFNQEIPFSSKCTKPLPSYIGTEHTLNYDYICSSTSMNTSGNIVNNGGSDHALIYSSTTITEDLKTGFFDQF